MDQPPFEVLFCELCGTSVPLQDLEKGVAIRHSGKVIGNCCLTQLRPATAERPGSGADARLLPVGLLVLCAIAAATMFLDHRVADEVLSLRNATTGLGGRVDDQAGQMKTLHASIDAAASRDQIAVVVDRVEAQERAVREFQAGVQASQAKSQSVLEELRTRLDALERSQPDYRPLFESLQAQLRQQFAILAELKALPQAPAEPSKPLAQPVPEVAPVPGLPPAMAHQVQRLTDPDTAVRFEAVDELLRTKDARVREHLLPLAKDSDLFVRRLVVEGLGEFKHSTCVEVLINALADPEEIVRGTAWDSLQKLTGQKIPFEATASRENRQRAQARWQDWWAKNKATFGP
jgi:HEAT repeats